MKLYEITIKPIGGLGTPLKGDTIFGHFCWQAVHDPNLLNGGLDRWIEAYPERPFAVFSSAWPLLVKGQDSQYALKRPDLPFSFFPRQKDNEDQDEYEFSKDLKKKKWLLAGEDLKLEVSWAKLLTDRELAAMMTAEGKAPSTEAAGESIWVTETRTHNTINRLTLTTGEGAFAPYAREVLTYLPEMELSIFVLLDEEATDIERVQTGLERIGAFGFGRDASTGLGRFEITDCEEKALPGRDEANALYTLGPCVPEKDSYRRMWFTPFVRFGRHGDVLAGSANPFKNPVIMADEGAVLAPRNKADLNRPYIGRAVTGVSLIQEKAVAQGYTVVLPVKLEAQNE